MSERDQGLPDNPALMGVYKLGQESASNGNIVNPRLLPREPLVTVETKILESGRKLKIKASSNDLNTLHNNGQNDPI